MKGSSLLETLIKSAFFICCMKEVVRKEILYDLTKSIEILQQRDARHKDELKDLSDHAIEDVAIQKDLDMVSVTVLIYSLYKVWDCLGDEYPKIVERLMKAKNSLEDNHFAEYNDHLRKLYVSVRRCNAKIKEHLQDVMQAARVKKGTVLLQKGLSIGQAAGLMGLSNWDLQEYAARTPALTEHYEKVSAVKRFQTAVSLFEEKK